MNVGLAILGLLLTIIFSVGVPTLLLMWAVNLPWLKALAAVFVLGMTRGNKRD